ncbi:polyketide cyclase [Sporocytophaga myxococcoides]|uniref:Polyketide cyclase n=1 Tax=Sporocytophaga myxococcoides TaxID=153721 RepID=A0A098LBN6_9BACT|nr:SRPBCC domain-containing protein [Sporocytophaga myxococcoides]GAL83822.1 polyketide cyclase [Sporocytophaga myxococcoides]
MAKEITTEIIIRSTPDKVWSILTDFEKYPTWNPFITSLTGKIETGKKIKVNIVPPGGPAMTFKPTILKNVPRKELAWLGSVFVKGLFDGEHRFELTDNEDGTVRFVQRERFEGVFVWMFNPQKTKDGFELMNRKLKALAEK